METSVQDLLCGRMIELTKAECKKNFVSFILSSNKDAWRINSQPKV